ncbi:MAG: serine/threonine protein kinase [Deltaproteobacteria bacterium]|nr:serine/threonine protein kinase [Deltaproteobacteria bacterium]
MSSSSIPEGADPGEVAALVAAGRLADAARLCAGSGRHAAAAELYERACDFASAAEQALLGAEPGRALRLAVLSGQAELCARARARVVSVLGPRELDALAADLCARGHACEAGELWCVLERHETAAGAFARAGEVLRAAQCHERAGQPAEAARVIEVALRSGSAQCGGPDREAELRVALGELYGRHGKHEAALRILQQVAPGSPLRRRALRPLATALERLGLGQALEELRAEARVQGRSLADADAAPAAATAVPPPSAAPARLFGRYDVVREVATTPHARVIEARDGLTGERVALKIFASRLTGAGRDALQRFGREARALARLQHPNVVPLRDFVATGPAIVLAWMGGGSLGELMGRGPVAPARAAEIARAVLLALGEAHRLGILHRDVKPSNVLLDEAGTPKLADFGAAHLAEQEATVTAAEIGTLGYMSPEQRLGRAASAPSDVYAAGVLLYEMLTGRLPEGDAAPSRHQPDLDERHDALCARLLAAQPERRLQSAEEARRAIEALDWPTRAPPRAAGPVAAPAAATSASASASPRLGPAREPARACDAAERRHDAWTQRDVLVVALDDASLGRAAAFARAGHPALPLVLRAERAAAGGPERGQIWIEAARGRSLADSGELLDAEEHACLLAAIEALHAAGGAHGCIDADHVFRQAGALRLAYPRAPAAAADAAGDRAALVRLRGHECK